MEKVTLTKNAQLIETYWEYDEEIKEGSYKDKIIDFVSPHYLHEKKCVLEEGITLQNIFDYMVKNIAFWSITIGNWCEEIVTEGLLPPEQANIESEYLELYWSLNVEEEETYFPYRMDFHGKHNDTNLSLSFCSANDLALLPVKVNTKLKMYNDKDEEKDLGNLNPTLFQILYGIIWELSFFGNP